MLLCIIYLFCIANDTKLSSLKWQTFVILQNFWKESENGLAISHVVLAQGLWWGCTQGMSQGFSYLKAWLRLGLSLQVINISLGRGFQSFITWTPWGCMNILMAWQLAFPRATDPREKAGRKLHCLLWPSYPWSLPPYSIPQKRVTKYSSHSKGMELNSIT